MLYKFLRKFLKIDRLEEEDRELRQRNNELRQRVEALESVIDIGADIHTRGGSWAVFCFPRTSGPDYVKFVNLDERSLREIQRFIRQFEHCRPVIDTPYPISRRDFMRL
jgi:hypothetical protein